MINADEALRIVLEASAPVGSETLSLEQSLGRVLARDIVARESIPPFANSSMDGFAVRSADLAQATSGNPVTLQIVGESSAGSPFGRKMQSGNAVRIMTGGMIPAGADAVVPIEVALVDDDTTVAFHNPVRRGEHIRVAGEDIRRGEKVSDKGTVIGPAQIGVFASLGLLKVPVFRRPVVNILATGYELVDMDKKPKAGQIRNSTSHSLAAYVTAEGGGVRRLGTVSDDRQLLRKSIKSALACDLLLITGGVSVGKYDYVKETLKGLGVYIKFWQVNIKPGKPLVFGRYKKTLVFGLPGNPASTSVTFLQFVRPAMHAMSGRVFKPFLVSGRIDHDFSKSDGKRHYVRCVAELVNGEWSARKAGSQSSGVMSSMSKANVLVIIPEEATHLKAGDAVQLELLHPYNWNS